MRRGLITALLATVLYGSLLTWSVAWRRALEPEVIAESRQALPGAVAEPQAPTGSLEPATPSEPKAPVAPPPAAAPVQPCLLYTSDAADDLVSGLNEGVRGA